MSEDPALFRSVYQVEGMEGVRGSITWLEQPRWDRESKVKLTRLTYAGTSRKKTVTGWMGEEAARHKLARWIREVEADGGEVFFIGRRVRGYSNATLNLPFESSIVQERVDEHDDRAWGPIEISVPLSHRLRVARGLVSAGYSDLAESLLVDGVMDLTGEGAAMVVLLRLLFEVRGTRAMGEKIARALGAMKEGRRNVEYLGNRVIAVRISSLQPEVQHAYASSLQGLRREAAEPWADIPTLLDDAVDRVMEALDRLDFRGKLRLSRRMRAEWEGGELELRLRATLERHLNRN